MPSASRPSPRPARRAMFALVVLVASLGVAEGSARLGGAHLFPQRRALDAMPGEAVPGEPNMVVDTVTGWGPRSGKQGDRQHERLGGEAHPVTVAPHRRARRARSPRKSWPSAGEPAQNRG